LKAAFIYVDAGKGHYVPAKAIYDRFLEKGHDATLDNLFLLLGSKRWNNIVKNAWCHQLRYPKIERIENRFFDNSINFYLLRFLAYISIPASKALKDWYEKEKPDFIFCTNYLASPLLTTILKRNNINIPLFILGTDVFDNQKIGVSNLVDVQYMPSQMGVKNYIDHGFDPSIVKFCPFPLKKGMSQYVKYSKIQARKELKIKLNKPTLIYNLGGEGIGHTLFMKALVKQKLDWQVIVLGKMCKKTEKKFNDFKEKHPTFSLVTPGFVNNVGLYIVACDVQLGKTGGNAFLESLYLHRPFLMSDLLYSSTSYLEFMKEYKVGWGENNIKKQIAILKQFFGNTEEQEEMERTMSSLPISFDVPAFVDQIVEDYRKLDTPEKIFKKRKIVKENIKKNPNIKNR
jgi:processive 1,2-diacylglycerol beta-glucosyltransferase